MTIPALRSTVRTCIQTAPSVAHRAFTHPQFSRLFQFRIPKTGMPRSLQQRRWNTTEGQPPPKGNTHGAPAAFGMGGVIGLTGGIFGTLFTAYTHLNDNPPSEKWIEFFYKMKNYKSEEEYAELQAKLDQERIEKASVEREKDALFAQKEQLEDRLKSFEIRTQTKVAEIASQPLSKKDQKLLRLELLSECPTQNCKDVLNKFLAAQLFFAFPPEYHFKDLSPKMLGKALKNNLNPSLQELSFTLTRILDNRGLYEILNSLKTNTSLKTLKINVLGREKRQTGITTLFFSGNSYYYTRDKHFTKVEMQALVELITENKYLEVIYLDENTIDDILALKLIPALKENLTITLSMKGTMLSPSTQSQLIEAAPGRIAFNTT